MGTKTIVATATRAVHSGRITGLLSRTSNPQLVAMIRVLTKDRIAARLLNNGDEPPYTPFLRAALDEAKRRRIEIEHPELQGKKR